MNLTQAKDLLKSLEPEKGQLKEREISWAIKLVLEIQIINSSDKEFLLMVLRRAHAESREVPDLKEKVKAAVLAGMDAMEMHWVQVEYGKDAAKNDDSETLVRELRALCAPDSPPSET